jgi:hypothetical protein
MSFTEAKKNTVRVSRLDLRVLPATMYAARLIRHAAVLMSQVLIQLACRDVLIVSAVLFNSFS